MPDAERSRHNECFRTEARGAGQKTFTQEFWSEVCLAAVPQQEDALHGG
jgi:hypothetical protein